MNIREEILEKSGVLNEMAAAELKKVEKLIKSGEIEKAADMYVQIGGNSGGVTRTVNSYIKKNPDVDTTNFDKFRQHFSGKRAVAGATKEKRKYKKKTAEEGRQGQGAAKKRNIERIVKSYNLNKNFLKTIDKKSVADLQKEAKDILDDWKGYTDKTSTEDTKDTNVLKAFVSDGKVNSKVMSVIKDTLEQGQLVTRDFGLASEKPEGFVTQKSVRAAEEKREKIKEKEGKK